MDRHRLSKRGVRHVCSHRNENGVDGFVATWTEDRRTQDFIGLRIDHHAHGPLDLAFLDCARDARHRPHSDAYFPACLVRLRHRHPDSTERRVDIECVGGDPIRNRAVGAVEQVRRDNLVVVVSGVGNAPRPLQSPRAQMPSTFVRSCSSTAI